jgi:hypothetical protein
LATCNDEIRQADAEFATVLLHHLDSEEAANRAKIRAETSRQRFSGSAKLGTRRS